MPQVSLSVRFEYMLNDHLLFFLPRWSTQRIVFGKPLNSQAVIRAKLASMISRVEACQNWFESTTYQMNNVSTVSTGRLDWMTTTYEIDELQPTGRQARRSYWSIEAVRSLFYISFKIPEILRFVSRTGRETAEGEVSLQLLSFYSLPFNISFQSQTLPRSLVDEL